MDPLIVDIYAGDGRGVTEVHRLAAAGAPWHGVMFKATHGANAAAPDWFAPVWSEAHGVDCGHTRERLGVDWFVFPYAYWLANQDPIAQADALLREVSRGGGWRNGTAYPVIDVESGGQPAGVSRTQAIDSVSRMVERVKNATGRDVVLYAGNWLRELGTRHRMGCKYVWPAAYTPALPASSYLDLGFGLAELFAWQYNGDGDGHLAGYPHTTPLGPEDISAVTVAGGGADALEHLRTRSWPHVS